MKINFNVLDRQFQRYQDEYEKAAKGVLRSGWYILGPEVESFEKEFAKFVGTKYAVGLNSGLDALILAFRALGIGKRDEVIAPANTYIASILGITENQATPVLVEPDNYYNIDADLVEEAITPKTKAILIVHLYGQPTQNIEKIQEIAKKHNLKIVEDCAQSHGASYKKTMTGNIGDVGCFSFYPTKNLGGFGDGGAITTNSETISQKVRALRNYGSLVKYQHDIEGVNSRLDELQAALLKVKLKHIRELTEERKKIAQRYLEEIKSSLIGLPVVSRDSEHVFHLFVIRIKDRDRFQKYLVEKGIQTAIHYPVPPHLSKAYKKLGLGTGSFPITESYANTIISLPLYNGMEKEETDHVIKIINQYK